MLFYIHYLQNALEKKVAPTLDKGFVGELSKQRSQLVAIEDVEEAMGELRRITTARVMAVAPRLAPHLLGETSRVMVHAKIEKALKEVLLTLSKREARRHGPAK